MLDVLAEETMRGVVLTLLSWAGAGVIWWVVWIVMLWLAVSLLRVPLRFGRLLELALGGAVLYVIMRCVVCLGVAFILGNSTNQPPAGTFETMMAAIFGNNAKRPPDWVFELVVAFPLVAALVGQSIARRGAVPGITDGSTAQPAEEATIGFGQGALVTLVIFAQVAFVEIVIQMLIMPQLFKPVV